MPADPKRVRDLFLAAAELPPEARPLYLAEVCGPDADLRAGVERLLTAHDHPASVLEVPVPDVPDKPAPIATFVHSPATEDHTPPRPESGTVIAGKYKLVEEIGEGGMGSVWMAQQTEPVKRFVAVKLIKAGMDSRAVLARFEAERQALALMDHPNIARVLDAGATPDGRPFFVMELVKGVPITRYCDEKRLTPWQRLELFVPVCQAIQHAHQKGVIHRDIKPSNVLIALYDDRPVPKVIDFGIAKAAGQQLTEKTLATGLGAVVGTPEYMSPEQASFNNLDIDTRSDVYALGVLLYELLAGSPPFSKKELEKVGLLEILRVIREQEAPRPSTKLSTADALPTLSANRGTEPAKLMRLLRGELDWIVMKALEKERTLRYETANSFAADVQRYLAGEPVQAVPPSAGYRLRKFLRKNRGPVLAAALVFLVLLGGIAGTTIGLLRANVAADAERAANTLAQNEKTRAERAAAEAKAAKEQTERRLTQIEKGVVLLARILRGINPKNEERGGPTLYEQLSERAEKAADELDAESVGDPLVVARLQTILGYTLTELGKEAKAVEVLAKARATHELELGADHSETLTTLNYLGHAYYSAGRLPEAIALHEQLRDAMVKKWGTDATETLIQINNLARAYFSAYRLPEALALHEQVRDGLVNKLGADHPDTLITLHNLAKAYSDDDRLPEAIALFEQVREVQTKKLGADHPTTLITRNNLARTYSDAGRLPEGIALAEQVRDARVKKFGADHPATLQTLNVLAVAYYEAGRLSEAIALHEQVRDARVRRLGADHPDTLQTLNNLGQAYYAAGRLPEAIALHERVRDVQVKELGADHPDTLITLSNLALAYKAAGRLPEAIALNLQVREVQLKKFGADHHATLTTFGNLGDAYGRAGQGEKAALVLREFIAGKRKRLLTNQVGFARLLAQVSRSLQNWKQHATAEEMLRECLSIREKIQPGVWSTFNTQSLLGGALLGQKKYAEAEPLLLAGYEGMKQREKAIPPVGRERLPESVDRLIELYTAIIRPDEVKKWRAERSKYPFVAPSPRARVQ